MIFFVSTSVEIVHHLKKKMKKKSVYYNFLKAFFFPFFKWEKGTGFKIWTEEFALNINENFKSNQSTLG